MSGALPPNRPTDAYDLTSSVSSSGSGTPIGSVVVDVSATRCDSVCQRKVSPSDDKPFGLPLLSMKSIATMDAALGSLTASARPFIVARMKSVAAVGCAAMNVLLVYSTPNDPGI